MQCVILIIKNFQPFLEFNRISTCRNLTMTEKYQQKLELIRNALINGDYQSANLRLKELAEQFPRQADIFGFLIEYTKEKLEGRRLLKSVEHSPVLPSELKKTKGVERKSLSLSIGAHKLPINVLVISWDIGHNPLGRAYMLAEAVQRVAGNVLLVGYQFERYGSDVWEPVRESKIPIVSLKGKMLPELLDEAEKMVERYSPDVVIACKPRLPSVNLGMLFKARKGIPLIIDVDDHELSFTKGKSDILLTELKKFPDTFSSIVEPYESEWTQLSHNLVGFADDVIVSNIALESEFGGHQIPHVRDENAFEPSRFDDAAIRRSYGVPEKAKVVMFFGTPRVHKGIGKVAEAVAQINDDNFLFVVVGTSPDKRVTNELDKLSKGKLLNIPNQPFSSIPEILSMADVVCLPQDVAHETSKYQLPAKAMDAIAMCKPLLVSNTVPLKQLVDAGVAELIDEGNLASQIQSVANRKPSKDELKKRKEKFLSSYSYSSAEPTLRKMFKSVLDKKGTIDTTEQENFWESIRSVFSKNVRSNVFGGIDIVLFWKQNDSGLYGRRHDMVAKILSERKDVRKVLVIDAPISTFDLNQKASEQATLTQERAVYIKTYEKKLGQLDSEKICYDVFIHQPGIYYSDKPIPGRVSLLEDYSEFLTEVFDREGITPKESVFWFYPKNYLAEDLVGIFEPKSVVVDVVDDHRTWPNVSEREVTRLTEHYESLLSKADLAFANCQSVFDSMSTFTNKILLVPNGCDKTQNTITAKTPLINQLKAHSGPIVGFVGNLESKIDIELLEKIAQQIPDVLLVLVGSTHANPEVRRLKEFSNVIMPGVIENRFVNAVICEFTVCIVPHKRTSLTANMNPLKVFVYLSNKKPVVTTNIDNLPESDAIFVSNNHEQFIDNVKLTIKKTISVDVFERFIEENCWEARFKCLDSFL